MAYNRVETQFGQLALVETGQYLPLTVLESAAGFYIGTIGNDGPVSRESVEYWATKAGANKALSGIKGRDWTQRSES